MGEFGDCVQNMQLFKGEQDSRRSKYAYKNLLEKLIINDLIAIYKGQPITIQNDLFCYIEVPDLKINLEYLRFAFEDFKKITIDKFGVHIAYGENNNEL